MRRLPHFQERPLLLATDFLLEALSRTTFILGLDWRSPGDRFRLQEDGRGGGSVLDGCAFSDLPPVAQLPGRWVEVEATASGSPEQPMQVRLRLRVPLATQPPPEGTAHVRDGYPSALFDASAAAWILEDTVFYPGYDGTSIAEVDPEFTLQERERTLDRVLRCFVAARDCAIRQAGAPAQEWLRQQELVPLHARPAADARRHGEDFTAFVLARMVRWSVVSLDEGGEARRFLQAQAARTLQEEETQLLQAEGHHVPSGHAAACARRIEAWFRQRLVPGSADDAYFDAVLFEIDRNARARLAGVMPSPPARRPLRQQMLLEDSVRTLPLLWAGVRLASDSTRAALAVGLDLPLAAISTGFADAIARRCPQLAQRPGLRNTLLPPQHWLTPIPEGG